MAAISQTGTAAYGIIAMNKMLLALLAMLVISISGCKDTTVGTQPADPADIELPVLQAVRATNPVRVDGLLDDEVWRRARVYQLSTSVDRQTSRPLLEEGCIQFAWDNEYFYLAAKFKDSDVVAEGEEDQLHHYQFGDVCELFLKPADNSWYWELYVTPRGNKTSFWFPGRGRLGLPSCFEYTCGLKVAAHVAGTVNNWRDRDDYWTAEMAMPIKDLTAFGDSFGPGGDWRILVGRYNYSIYLPAKGPEHSSSPQLPVIDYHLLKGYAKLELAD